MKAIVSLVLSLVVLGIARAEDEGLPPADGLLARYGAALGAAERPTSQVVHAEIRLEGTAATGTSTERMTRDRYLFEGEIDGVFRSTEGFDGRVVWYDDEGGARFVAGAHAAASARAYGILALRPWADLYDAAATVGESSLGGRPHFELELRAGDAVERWWLDAETSLLSRVDFADDVVGGGLFERTRLELADWRDVSGVRLPFVRTWYYGPGSLTQTVERIDVNAELPDELFALPPRVAEMVAADRARGLLVELKEVAEQPTLTIRQLVPPAEISRALAALLPQVYGYVMEHGIATVGMPFTRYHGMKDGKVEIEAGMMVEARAEGDGRVKPSTLPAGRVASTWHVGPYHGLTNTHRALERWIAEHGLEPADRMWEVYWTDPGTEPDPMKWRTEVVWPVKERDREGS